MKTSASFQEKKSPQNKFLNESHTAYKGSRLSTRGTFSSKKMDIEDDFSDPITAEEKQKYKDAKQERKQLEQEIQMIKSRLNLLEMEDEKTLRRIEETKKKTSSILKIKIRNNQLHKDKEIRTQQDNMEREKKTEIFKKDKEQRYQNIQNMKEFTRSYRIREVMLLKQSKSQLKLVAAESEKDYMRTQMLNITHQRLWKKQAEEIRLSEMEDRKIKTRVEYRNRVAQEIENAKKMEMQLKLFEEKKDDLLFAIKNLNDQKLDAACELEKAIKSESSVDL